MAESYCQWHKVIEKALSVLKQFNFGYILCRIKIQGKDLIKWKKLGLQNPWTNASIYSKYFVSSRICWIYYAEVPSGISDKVNTQISLLNRPNKIAV